MPSNMLWLRFEFGIELRAGAGKELICTGEAGARPYLIAHFHLLTLSFITERIVGRSVLVHKSKRRLRIDVFF